MTNKGGAMFIAKLKVAGAVLAVTAGWCALGGLAAEQPAAPKIGKDGLSPAEFEKLHNLLQPPQDEMWRSIPWQVSIVEARELAAKEKKPIFVWVASGEPLGCG
jgi:hypothetical protein